MENNLTFKQIIGEEVKKDEDCLEVETAKNLEQFSTETGTKINKVRTYCINRARERVEMPLSAEYLENDNNNYELESSLDDVWELDDSLIPEQRKRMSKRTKLMKRKTTKLKKQDDDDAKKKELIKLITKGDLEKIISLIYDLIDLTNQEEIHEQFCELINKTVDDHSNTLLHVAAIKEQTDVLEFFLRNDANPCLKNKYQKTAYTCTQSIKVKEILKQFARDVSNKFNYNNAKIPIDTDTNQEIVDVKEAMRKIMREKEKKHEKENENKKKEKKIIKAAKRKIMSQSGKPTGKCVLCENEIVGKVPVEYNIMQNLFCTLECLEDHRMLNPLVWS